MATHLLRSLLGATALLGCLCGAGLVATEARAQSAGLSIAGGLTPSAFEAEATSDPVPTDQPLMLANPLDGEPVPARAVPERLIEPGTVLDSTVIAPRDIQDVSAQAGAAMLLDDQALDEMPYEASSGRWFWNGGWYVGGESLWMDRSRNNRVLIARDISIVSGTANTVPVTTNNQQFNVAPGARITIGKSLGRDYVDRDRYLDFIWYGGLGWNNNAIANADGRFVSPLNPEAFGFNGSTQIAQSMSTDFNSFEVNYRLRRRLGRDQLMMSPNGNWTRHAERGWLPGLIIGGRIAHINDFLTIQSSIPGTSLSQFGGTYRITATNWLMGLNVGGELISQNEFYYWGLRGRAAPCISLANSTYDVYGTNTIAAIGPTGTTSFSGAGTRNFGGVITDLTLLAGWNITPNFSLQAGYDFLWVAGIATAPRQLDLKNRTPNSVDAGGNMFYNGVSFGFNGSW